jgi:hypothetical protein
MPERYRVRYARSADEVLSELGRFVEYVRSSPVINMLPSVLHDISSRNAGDVAKWQARIARMRPGPPLGATARFWLDLVGEMFNGARDRLEELHGKRSTGLPPHRARGMPERSIDDTR